MITPPPPRPVPPLDDPIVNHARRDYLLLKENLTIQQALDTIRAQGVGDRIIYFYVVDDQDRLVGVLPTRRLLLAVEMDALAGASDWSEHRTGAADGVLPWPDHSLAGPCPSA